MTAHRHSSGEPGAPDEPDEPGTEAPRARPFGRYSLRASVGLGAVGLLAGLLFSTSASLASDSSERRPENLRDLVRSEQARLAETNAELEALRNEVADLYAEQADPEQADPATAFASGTTAVQGPGLVVRLWDAPVPVQLPDNVTGDDLVVHQQDLEAVMNGLWAGGAEAMTVQGHRVTATTSVRCVGNVLLIDGATYSPPYEIAAIGDPAQLETTLLATQPIQIYLQYVDALDLGWSVEASEELTMPADDSNLALEYADVPG